MPDDFEDPALTAPAARPSFWATVEWRLGVGLVVCLLTGVTVFVLSVFNARHPLDIPCMTVGSVAGIAFLWVVSRILWAWVEWPSSNRVVRGVKAVIRYLAFDAAAE